jgi:predicted nucleic acid-binding protein
MTVVVDASVALKWFVAEEQSDAAYSLLRSDEPLTAPEMIVTEVTNAAWRKLIRSEITQNQAMTIASGIRYSDVEMLPTSVLNERALEIAAMLNHPVYDCLYLACAEETGATVITADRRFYRAAADGGFARRIALLGGRRRSAAPP